MMEEENDTFREKEGTVVLAEFPEPEPKNPKGTIRPPKPNSNMITCKVCHNYISRKRDLEHECNDDGCLDFNECITKYYDGKILYDFISKKRSR